MPMTAMNNSEYFAWEQFADELAVLQEAVKTSGWTYESPAGGSGKNNVMAGMCSARSAAGSR